MSNSSNRTGASTKDVSTAEAKPRLSLTRERVKELRVQSGCKTGFLIANGPPLGPVTGNNNRCTYGGQL
ncbi:MAG: hypothetical protein ACLQVI_08060 [Polyangiaceae bacterium]